jgi:hypothetical protein
MEVELKRVCQEDWQLWLKQLVKRSKNYKLHSMKWHKIKEINHFFPSVFLLLLYTDIVFEVIKLTVHTVRYSEVSVSLKPLTVIKL